jgi:hypothetical protein
MTLMCIAFSPGIMFENFKQSVFGTLTIVGLGEGVYTEEKVINIL